MDSIFGIGAPELIFILLLAGLLMGPHQIRRVARLLGLWTARAQRTYRGFMAQLNDEIDALEGEEIREAAREVRNLGRQVSQIGRDMRGAPAALLAETSGATRESRQAVRDTLRELVESPPAGEEAASNGETAALPAEDAENTIQPPRPIEVADDPAT